MRNVHVQYFAVLREQAGCSRETVVTGAATAAQLYDELRDRHGLRLPRSTLRVAIKEDVTDWSHPLGEGDQVVFIPPVAGG